MILHVFAKAVPDLSRVDLSDLGMDVLHARLQEVERDARTNPLEEELNLGSDTHITQKRRQRGGAGNARGFCRSLLFAFFF